MIERGVDESRFEVVIVVIVIIIVIAIVIAIVGIDKVVGAR